MPTINLAKILPTVSLKDFRRLLSVKVKLDARRKRRAAIHRELTAVERRLERVEASLPPYARDRSSLPDLRRALERARKDRRPRQPTIEALMVELFRERKRPLSVNELTDGVLNEKGYKSTSPNFRNQLRVLLYRNRKGLYQRVGKGRFTLANGKAPPAAGRGVPKRVK